MYIPLELQYNIISFIPFSNLKLVCKEWSEEITIIQKNAVDIISEWYWKRRVPKIFLGPDMRTHFSVVRFFVVHLQDIYFFQCPGFITLTCGLNLDIMNVLPDILRKSDVKDWIINLPIDPEDCVYEIMRLL